MTREEALKLVEEEVKNQTCDEYPYWWVGDIMGERDYCFFIEATIYSEGENPEEDHSLYTVWKETGEVTLPGGITIDVNELGEIVKPEKKP